ASGKRDRQARGGHRPVRAAQDRRPDPGQIQPPGLSPEGNPMRRLVLTAAALAPLVLAAALPAATQAKAKVKVPAAAASAIPPTTPADWRTLDPENVLVIDTNKGRIFVELSPEIAPEHVARIKLLTRQRFYDGLKFHRVIDGFMAQTGDPLGTGEGQSPYPN